MSEGFHHQNQQQGIFSFPANGLVDRTADQHQAEVLHPGVYENSSSAGMLSEMFSFAGANPPDSAAAAAMQLFLTSPNPRSPTPPPHHHHHHHPPPTHMLLPSQGFLAVSGHQPDPTWFPEGAGGGQGLSLSLSSTLEAAKAEEELRGGGMMFFGNNIQEAPSSSSFKTLHDQNQHLMMHLQEGYGITQHHHSGHFGFGSSPATPGFGLVNALRNSKYTRSAQELLEEFCSVGRGHVNKNKLGRNNSNTTANAAASTSGGGSKDPPPLSTADRMEHQRKKVKLLTMLDEVERRYNHYCEQMQMVVNSYDVVMGYGAATPYTGLAQKAMSRHFRCLKDAIEGQLKRSCEVLGEKDAGGVTKGETPRLKALELSLRQQRAFHQMGTTTTMEHDAAAAWRPQRGLPHRSLNILRAWLFEHFLHPYPSDADKHLLARQTGLSRNQVSNWFINARVRLWKPMVEEMYQQESKERDDHDQDQEDEELDVNNNINNNRRIENAKREIIVSSAQTPMHSCATTTTTKTTQLQEAEAETDDHATAKTSQINAPEGESDPSFFPINSNPIITIQGFRPADAAGSSGFETSTTAPDIGGSGGNAGPTMIRFGTSGGDVSLTLGLRRSSARGGTQPETSAFSFREFAS